MKTVGEQAKMFREHRGWNSTQMARAVGTSRQNIENLEKAGAMVPRYLPSLASTMGLSSDELLQGRYVPKEEVLETSFVFAAEPQPSYAGRPRPSRRVPVVGTARLGDDGYYEEISVMAGAGDGHIDIATNDENAYCLRVRGDSMMPAIRDGWYVLVEPNGQVREGEYVLLKLRQGQRMVKELLSQRGDAVSVMSVNGGERRTIYREDLEAMQAIAAVVSPSKWMPD